MCACKETDTGAEVEKLWKKSPDMQTFLYQNDVKDIAGVESLCVVAAFFAWQAASALPAGMEPAATVLFPVAQETTPRPSTRH